jgi:hypothetical protein
LSLIAEHEAITKAACPQRLAVEPPQSDDGEHKRSALAIILEANGRTDDDQNCSLLHFDNCTFGETAGRIASLWQCIETIVLAPCHQYALFGAIIHTVQDFYAHSNWVELHAECTQIPVWTVGAPLPDGIYSGTWPSAPRNYNAAAPLHSVVNKDSPGSSRGRQHPTKGPHTDKTFHDLVIDVSTRATKAQFARLLKVLQRRHRQAWFFCAGKCVLYDVPTDEILAGPSSIADAWPGLPEAFTKGMDAAINAGNRDVWVFAGNKYVGYDTANSALREGPRLIADGWPGLASPFTDRIDAAVNRDGYGYGHDVWLFSGDRYVRYDTASRQVASDPKPIADGWRPLAESEVVKQHDFTKGIDAAAHADDDYIWFFSGDMYVKYDAVKDTLVGGPTPIATGWPGLKGLDFTKGVHAVVTAPLH